MMQWESMVFCEDEEKIRVVGIGDKREDEVVRRLKNGEHRSIDRVIYAQHTNKLPLTPDYLFGEVESGGGDTGMHHGLEASSMQTRFMVDGYRINL
jgi:hypothetical protein